MWCCAVLTTPWTAVCQAPLSIGFSRQEYWSGLPDPPPGDFPQPRDRTQVSTSQADALPSEAPGKPKNTGVGIAYPFSSGSPTQELNKGLLHCKWIFLPAELPGKPHYTSYDMPIRTSSIVTLQTVIYSQKASACFIFIL